MELYHYPPDVLNLLVDTIPRLNKSKRDVILFFKGAGVPDSIVQPLEVIIKHDKESIGKYEMTRQVLEKLNDNREKYLGQRREILKRACQFDTFDVCFDNDRDRAKANVAELSKMVNMKDTLTRYEIHLKAEQQKELDKRKREIERQQLMRKQFDELNTKFNALFSLHDPVERGIALEPVLNGIFSFYQIGLSEAFKVKIDKQVVEQIDGAIMLDGKVYLIEMKWEKEPIGVDKVAVFTNRLFTRNDVGGMIISASSFTSPAIKNANELLSHKSIALIELKDVYDVIDQKKDLQQYIRQVLGASQLNRKVNIKIDVTTIDDLDFVKLQR